MCWLLRSSAREENVMCFEWQSEVSHTDTSAIMILLLGKVTQPEEGAGKNVSVQANARTDFGSSCHLSA